MRYEERPSCPALRPWVHCIWTFEAHEPGAAPDRIVPDGRPELVIHCGEPFHELDARGRSAPQARVVFAGQLTRPLRLRSPGNAHVVGVRFKPAGARAFIGQPMCNITDRRIAVAANVPADAEAFVLERIRGSRAQDDPAVGLCTARIESSRGQSAVAELAAAAGLGRRQLERRFADVVGIGPGLLAAIFRFRSVFDLIEHDAQRPWTDAAIGAGYYDQSHFIREFRRFVGCTPSEFQRSRGALAASLVES